MNKWKTYLILIFVMATWGFNVPALKILVSEFTPVTITSLRIFTAGVTVFIILGIMNKIRKPTLKEGMYIVGGGLLNVVSHHYFLSVGLTQTTSTNGGLILGTGPLLTALLASILLKNRPTVIKVIGFLLGSIGVTTIVLSSGEGVGGLNVGDLSIFISIFSQALSFIIISRAAKTLDPRLLTGYMLLFGSLVLFAISLVTEPQGLHHLGDAPKMHMDTIFRISDCCHSCRSYGIQSFNWKNRSSGNVNLPKFEYLLLPCRSSCIFRGKNHVSSHNWSHFYCIRCHLWIWYFRRTNH